jgi:DNA-binding NtrC family response regulator
VHHVLWRFRQETGKPVEGVTPEALLKLEAHDWPGNVRELENSVYRAVVASRGPFLTAADFPDADAAGTPRFMSRPQPEPARPVPAALSAAPSAPAAQQLVTMEDYERAAIVRALGEAKGNVTMAAERLRVPRSTLYRRLKALNISAG